MLIPVSSVFIMFTFLAIGETSAFAQPVDFMVTICAVFLLMVNLLVFGINQYNQKKSQEYTDMQLLLQKESDFAQYYEMILSQSENQSILIHDIKKHLQSIKLLNEKNDSDKINAYIQQMCIRDSNSHNPFSCSRSTSISNFRYRQRIYCAFKDYGIRRIFLCPCLLYTSITCTVSHLCSAAKPSDALGCESAYARYGFISYIGVPSSISTPDT